MRLRRFLLSALTLALAVFGFGAPRVEYVPGSIMVKFKPGYEAVSQWVHSSLGSRVSDMVRVLNVQEVQLRPGFSEVTAVKYYSQLPYVEYAHRNNLYRAVYTPNDPLLSQQWHHNLIQALQGWDVNRGDASIIVAICDTGINMTHPDLAGKIVAGYDFINNDDDATDDNGHGTFCAGLAAAQTDNNVGVAGVGFNCWLMPVKVLSGGGGGSDTSVANGILFAAQNGAKVANLSLGSYGQSQTLQNAVDQATSLGTLVVGAAGNDNVSNLFYPAAYANCLAVGSTTQSDQKSSFSNWGNWVDVAAPGSSVVSTNIGGAYSSGSGTSFACPIVAGQAGLVFSHMGIATPPATVRLAIEENTDPVGSWLRKGRVNVFKSLVPIPTFTDVPHVAGDVQTIQGFYGGGDVNSLFNVDGNTYNVTSINVRSLGDVAAIRADFSTTTPLSDIQRIQVEMNVAGMTNATTFVHIWNFNTNDWDFLRAFPVSSSMSSTLRTTVPQPYSRYVSGGQIRIALRTISPRRGFVNQYLFRTDRVRLMIRQPISN